MNALPLVVQFDPKPVSPVCANAEPGADTRDRPMRQTPTRSDTVRFGLILSSEIPSVVRHDQTARAALHLTILSQLLRTVKDLSNVGSMPAPPTVRRYAARPGEERAPQVLSVTTPGSDETLL